MPVAAIEALIELLGEIKSSTVFETIEILESQIDHLKASVPNPIPPSAGADLFMKTLLKSLRQETKAYGGSGGNMRVASNSDMSFDEMRQYLLRNSRNFAAQAKAARVAIADVGARYVKPGSTVMTSGGSRCVKQMLLRAAEARAQANGSPDFRVIYVMDGSHDSGPAVRALREQGVPVSAVDVSSAAHAMKLGGVDRVFVGAEAVCQRGGVLSRMGTYQLAVVAKSLGKDFYVVTETHKFARMVPLDQSDVASPQQLGVKQNVLNFKKGSEPDETVQKSAAGSTEWRADYTVSGACFIVCQVRYHGLTYMGSHLSSSKLSSRSRAQKYRHRSWSSSSAYMPLERYRSASFYDLPVGSVEGNKVGIAGRFLRRLSSGLLVILPRRGWVC